MGLALEQRSRWRNIMQSTSILILMAAILAHELNHIRHNNLWIMQMDDNMSRITHFMLMVGWLVLIDIMKSLQKCLHYKMPYATFIQTSGMNHKPYVSCFRRL